MQVVNQIACVNNAGFVQKFRVKWANNGASGWSDYYPNPNSQTMNLSNFTIPVNSEVWIEVDAFWGKTNSSKDHVQYSPTAQATATYKTTGTTLDYNITLEGSN